MLPFSVTPFLLAFYILTTFWMNFFSATLCIGSFLSFSDSLCCLRFYFFLVFLILSILVYPLTHLINFFSAIIIYFLPLIRDPKVPNIKIRYINSYIISNEVISIKIKQMVPYSVISFLLVKMWYPTLYPGDFRITRQPIWRVVDDALKWWKSSKMGYKILTKATEIQCHLFYLKALCHYWNHWMILGLCVRISGQQWVGSP